MRKNIKFEYENDAGEGSGALCYGILSIVLFVIFVWLFGRKLLHFVLSLV